MFVDRVTIRITAGNGGNGSVSFRREKYIPHGGPDGGDGGNGGSIIIRAETGVDSLASLSQKRHWKANSGMPGGSENCHGRGAEDYIITVPPGTLVIDAESGLVLRDLVQSGDQVNAARGGRGGKGNTRFKSSTNRSPREATLGGTGESRTVILELKVIADVGLIGKPNAGKSTLLSRLSRARPQVANYPFTTKYPNLGIVYINLDYSFVLADLPGLIEGAHTGVGLGHEFLKHVERAGILVHLIEPLPMDGTEPLENYRSIRSELEQYDAQLAQRPEIVVVSKSELPEAVEVQAQIAAETQQEVLTISAVTGEGLDHLLRRIAQLLEARNVQE